jgi:hypothetical protein
MNKIYYAIPALALFGDLVLKRFLQPYWALACLYTIAVLILVWIVVLKWDKKSLKLTALERRISFVIYYLVIAYIFQSLISLDIPFIYSLTHVIYICVPLLYIPLILRYCPDFDLQKLSTIFLLMMIPVNIVGLVQYFINPDFLISTVYDAEGGIIFRNSYQGVFLRFPSIFTSADRYSAIGLIQLYFTIILLSLSNKKTAKMNLWICFNLISSIVGMCIAGARSRILILLLLMVLMALSSFVAFRPVLRKTFFNLRIAILIILSVGVLTVTFNPSYVTKIIEAPSIRFLITSIKEGNIENRIGEYASHALLSDDVPLSGKGLGALGNMGKPAEMGIESIWIECGFIGGLLILIGFSGIILILALLSCQAFIKGQLLNVLIFGLPALSLTTGLFTGLTAVFELSSAIMLMSGIAGTIRHFSTVDYYKNPELHFSFIRSYLENR